MKPIIALILLLITLLFVPSCATTGIGTPKLTFDPISGICVLSEDGDYAVCVNPLTKPVSYSVKATVPGGVVRTLVYESRTGNYTATLPDGSKANYRNGVLTIEPPLPVGKDPTVEPYPTK